MQRLPVPQRTRAKPYGGLRLSNRAKEEGRRLAAPPQFFALLAGVTRSRRSAQAAEAAGPGKPGLPESAYRWGRSASAAPEAAAEAEAEAGAAVAAEAAEAAAERRNCR